MASEAPAPALPEDLLEREARRVSRRYRVDPAAARSALAEAFAARPGLLRRIAERWEREDVTRWRDYREVLKACRKGLYYGLRRYYADPAGADALVEELERAAADGLPCRAVERARRGLLDGHVSTRERGPYLADFYAGLFGLCGVPPMLLDVGCGMQPLAYTFADAGAATALYVAVDRDERAVRAACAWGRLAAPGRLAGAWVDVADPSWASEVSREEPFDLALMLKVVPVLRRLDRAAGESLARVPARRLLVTGCTESMTRRGGRIERRERAVLARFLKGSGRRVVGEFRAGTEFGLLSE